MFNEDRYQTPIISALRTLSQQERVALHMPGHKRGALGPSALVDWLGNDVLKFDQTEIGELDSLHAPCGPIAAAERLAAELYQVEGTFFTTNGSSAGLIAALMAATQPGDTVLLPRNVHKSIISGLVLADLQPLFLDPVYDGNFVLGLTEQALQEVLEAPEQTKPTAVLLVHPGFEGGCTDVLSLVRKAHQYGCRVIVDEAHGAHFRFHPALPKSATEAGADIVVHSAHKTLSALTGGAWVHYQGHRVSAERLRQCLNLVQSTSPSWLILGSLDAARLEMAMRGYDLLGKAIAAAADLELTIQQRTPFSTWSTAGRGFARDQLKVSLLTADCGYSGNEVATFLQEAGIFAEMSSPASVLLMLTVADAKQPLGSVADVLAKLKPLPPLDDRKERTPPLPKSIVGPRAAYLAEVEWVLPSQAIGRISARSIYRYPPGIPLVIPGQLFDQELIGYIHQIETDGSHLNGLSDRKVAVACL